MEPDPLPLSDSSSSSNEPARARRVKKRQAASTAGGSEVFPISIEYSKPCEWREWLRGRFLCHGSAFQRIQPWQGDLRMPALHEALFLMREQQGQTAMDPSGFELWTFDASPQPFEIGL